MTKKEASEQLNSFIQAFEYAPGYIQTNGLSDIIIDFIENELGYKLPNDEKDVTSTGVIDV